MAIGLEDFWGDEVVELEDVGVIGIQDFVGGYSIVSVRDGPDRVVGVADGWF